MAATRSGAKQNVTVSQSKAVVRKARILSARRETSISGLLAQEIEFLVGNEEAQVHAEQQALELLDRGFHMGGVIRASREEVHKRSDICRHECLDLRARRRCRGKTRNRQGNSARALEGTDRRPQHAGAAGVLRECHAEDRSSDVERIGRPRREQLCDLVHRHVPCRDLDRISDRA